MAKVRTRAFVGKKGEREEKIKDQLKKKFSSQENFFTLLRGP